MCVEIFCAFAACYHIDRVCRLKRLKTLILPGSLSLKDVLKIKAKVKVSSDACDGNACWNEVRMFYFARRQLIFSVLSVIFRFYLLIAFVCMAFEQAMMKMLTACVSISR